MIDIIPGILEKEWSEIEGRLQLVAGYVEWVQIDVADNTLVPNETFKDFTQLSPYAQKLFLEGF